MKYLLISILAFTSCMTNKNATKKPINNFLCCPNLKLDSLVKLGHYRCDTLSGKKFYTPQKHLVTDTFIASYCEGCKIYLHKTI